MQLLKNFSSNTATGENSPAISDRVDVTIKNTEAIKEDTETIINMLEKQGSPNDDGTTPKPVIKLEFVIDFQYEDVVFDFSSEEKINQMKWSDYLCYVCVDFDNSLKNNFLKWDNNRKTTDYEVVIKDNRMTKLLNEFAPIENKLTNNEELSLSEISIYENYNYIKQGFLHNAQIKSKAISLFLADDAMCSDLNLNTSSEVLEFIRQIINHYRLLADNLSRDKYKTFDIFLRPSPKGCGGHFTIRFINDDIDFDCTYLGFGPELIIETSPSHKTKRIIAIEYYMFLAYEIMQGRNIYADKNVLNLFGRWQIGNH